MELLASLCELLVDVGLNVYRKNLKSRLDGNESGSSPVAPGLLVAAPARAGLRNRVGIESREGHSIGAQLQASC